MFENYVAVDWAMSNMAIARMTTKSKKITTIDVPSSISDLKAYLKNLQGSICLTFEETTSAHWLYTELREMVDKIIVCDPYRNKLLSEGAKTDKIDAEKLVKLLRADLLKEVFHSDDKFIEIRKIASGYEDLVKAGVRLKNQKSAIYRSQHKKTGDEELDCPSCNFVLEGINKQIISYENEKKRYLNEFKKLEHKHIEISRVRDIPGMGYILAIKTVARIVDAKRFKDRNHFLSYCGLVKLDRMSGGKSYGKRNSRYCRTMKDVFKTATLASYDGNNQFGEYYSYLINEKKLAEHNARNAVARKIATIVYGVMKNNINYDPFLYRKKDVDNFVDQ
jgi:transposase